MMEMFEALSARVIMDGCIAILGVVWLIAFNIQAKRLRWGEEKIMSLMMDNKKHEMQLQALGDAITSQLIVKAKTTPKKRGRPFGSKNALKKSRDKLPKA